MLNKLNNKNKEKFHIKRYSHFIFIVEDFYFYILKKFIQVKKNY